MTVGVAGLIQSGGFGSFSKAYGMAAGSLLEAGIVEENAAQMMRVGRAIVFDEARRLDDAHNIWIELAAVETVPGNIIERPAVHGSAIPPASFSAAG